jgi:hypothetical protein
VLFVVLLRVVAKVLVLAMLVVLPFELRKKVY